VEVDQREVWIHRQPGLPLLDRALELCPSASLKPTQTRTVGDNGSS
jgi:hypothetical protein